MDEDNLSKAIMIGVTTLVGVMTVSAIIIFFNSSLNIVKNAGSGKNFGNIYRHDIESTLLMSNTGNYIKGTSVFIDGDRYDKFTNSIIFKDALCWV